MKRLILIALSMLLLMTGCVSNAEDNKNSTTDTTPSVEEVEKIEAKAVKVVALSVSDFSNQMTLPGTFSPYERIILSANISGELKSIKYDVGDKVSKNSVMATIDDTLYQLQLSKASIAVQNAKNNYDATLKNYNNVKSLLESGAVSSVEFDQVDLQLKSAQLALDLAKNDYAMANENVKYTVLKSPITGIVSTKTVNRGEMVGAGRQMYEVVDTSNLIGEIEVSEKYINTIKVGQDVDLYVSSVSGQSFKGKVHKILPEQRQGTKGYPVQILISNQEDLLKSGMIFEAKIILSESVKGVGLPKLAVNYDDEKYFVFVESNGAVNKREVTLGATSDGFYEVLSGVKEGENVVISGKEYLEDGDIVVVQE